MTSYKMNVYLWIMILAACKNNPFGEDIYKGKVIDETSNTGISGAQVTVMAKKKNGQGGYEELARCSTDASGDYVASYKRKPGFIYRIYAQKEFYSHEDPYNYAWGDHKKTTVKLKPLGFLKVRVRNVSGKFKSITFSDLLGGEFPSVDARVHPDTVICCFRLFANMDFSFDYFLTQMNGDCVMKGQAIRLRRFETDSIDITY
jgi:hypothetical protein